MLSWMDIWAPSYSEAPGHLRKAHRLDIHREIIRKGSSSIHCSDLCHGVGVFSPEEKRVAPG